MLTIKQAEWRWAGIWSVVLVLMAMLPYVVVDATTPEDLFFLGFLSNPEDGHSYLAKMRQGFRGEWSFHLPFTPEAHEGEFLFTYYLFLGHVARWVHLPLTWVFHLARAINGAVLLLVLYYAGAWFFHDVAQRRFAFLITALGSGLGWLVAFSGKVTADMWVPEGYVFYSLFVNPHFSLAMACMLLLILWSTTPWGAARIDWRCLAGLVACSVLLGLALPFSLLTVGVVLLVYTAFRWAGRRRLPWRLIASGGAIAVGGGPFVINAYLASTRNAAFAAWSAQNLTPSPPPWDVALSYGIVLLLAIAGAWIAIRRRRDSDLVLLIWTLCVAVLLYAPFSLQRRLITGWILPLGMLATAGWYALPARRRPPDIVAWILAGLTHLFLIGITLVGALGHSDLLFITPDELAALDWLAEGVAPDALVVASPRTGLHIPAWAGQRVLYGHRFETADAEARKAQLRAFYGSGDLAALQGAGPDEDASPDLRPDYVFYGPQEQAISGSGWQPDPAWRPVYQQGTVTIYALP